MRITVINAHPDPDEQHYIAALCQSYGQGATEGGHEIRQIEVGRLAFDFIRNQQDWRDGEVPVDIREAQDAITWCEHLVLAYPLWLGTMPALTKGFLEQTFRQNFAFNSNNVADISARRLRGRSARIIVTMGMPALIYRWFYGAHSLRAVKRNILRFCGFGPVRTSIVGGVGGSAKHREAQLARMQQLGKAGR
ncbi:putative NADPH-quinone reductase [Natronocella acetinitrilica]|uniref:NADPH-quinone reductase n=2 Tax=Natronocella acetinitrilica TaxID=414046 RepID=A0AAE3G0U1_9GAMM|nr:putative NADPH-quinone reductase [Natronocella acetinitrilica]